MKINFKTLGIKAAAIGGAIAAIWLAVKPAEKEETPDLLSGLPDLDAPTEAPAEEAAETTEETEETTEEEKTEE